MLIEIDDRLADCVREKLIWEAHYMNWHHITPMPPVLGKDVEDEIHKAVAKYMKEWIGSLVVEKMTEFSFREREVEQILRRIEDRYCRYVLNVKPKGGKHA